MKKEKEKKKIVCQTKPNAYSDLIDTWVTHLLNLK